jgi:hypothetical protein
MAETWGVWQSGGGEGAKFEDSALILAKNRTPVSVIRQRFFLIERYNEVSKGE